MQPFETKAMNKIKDQKVPNVKRPFFTPTLPR